MEPSVRPVGGRGGATRLQLQKQDQLTAVLQRQEHEVSISYFDDTHLIKTNKQKNTAEKLLQSILTEKLIWWNFKCLKVFY